MNMIFKKLNKERRRIMNYVLSKTTNGTTYYAMVGETNAVIKTEDIHQAKLFNSESAAKKLREHATKKLKGFKIHPVQTLPGEVQNQPDEAPEAANPSPEKVSEKEPVKMLSQRRSFSAEERSAVYSKSEGHCAICGEFVPYTKYTIDHIIPLAKGGSNDISNLQCACGVCNRIKQDILPQDLMEKLTKIMLYQVGQKANKKYKKQLRKACKK